MSFIDVLRSAASGKTTVLHKFLTNYDPTSPRVYAFAEGSPDLAFYREHILRFVSDRTPVYLYDCGGKSGVFEAYQSVIERFPQCVRVLFFVDKDLDDIMGKRWPSDPRVFTTECYSIENYLVCPEVLARFFTDFVKANGFDTDIKKITALFKEQLDLFHHLILPIMAWIIVLRRAGNAVALKNINPEELYVLREDGLQRKRQRSAIAYLSRVTETQSPVGIWRDVRRSCRELRRLPPKTYVRGKFEAWWLLKFIRKVTDELSKLAAESGGSISIRAQLQDSNLVQLLSHALPTPGPLKTFLGFHLGGDPRSGATHAPPPEPGLLGRMLQRLRKWVAQTAVVAVCGF